MCDLFVKPHEMLSTNESNKRTQKGNVLPHSNIRDVNKTHAHYHIADQSW